MNGTLERPRLFSIGAVSRQLGVSPSTIRRCETTGVVNPLRDEGMGRRLYTVDDVAAIRAERDATKHEAPVGTG